MPLTDEQLAAVQSIDKHVLVSAGAGSGKTSVLVERYLEVLRRNDDAEVGDIVAVTFTRKAAEEMRTRLKEGLKKLSDEATTEHEAERWNKCLVEIESSRIGTIHSLCDFLLKTRATEAAVDPRFELLDDLERAQLLDDSVRTTISYLIDESAAEHSELLDFPLEQITEMLKQLVSTSLKFAESRDLLLATTAPPEDESGAKNHRHRVISKLRAFARQFTKKTYMAAATQMMSQKMFKLNCKYLLDNPWPERGSTLAERQEEVCSLLIRLQDSKGADHEAMEQLAGLNLTRAGGEQGSTVREAIKAVRNEAKKVKLTPQLNEVDEHSFAIIASLIQLVEQTRHTYEQGKKHHQKLDFDDLIARTAELVQPAAGQRGITMHNMRALLVDEFQDTNKIQARMLAALAAGNPKTRLFLIGDDKQSIYKFQGADVGTFNLCKGIIGNLSETSAPVASADANGWPTLQGQGELRSLSKSFRSHPAIVEFVNVLFHRLFDATEDAEAFRSRFQALNAARTAEENAPCRVEIVTFPIDEDRDDASTEQEFAVHQQAPSTVQTEAKVLAKYIQECVENELKVFGRDGTQRPARYGDFAVLLQANGDFAAIEAALADREIPFVSFAGAGYLDRQEILDLENLLKWLLCPQDGHALLSALRSPMFGVSDDFIHEFKTKQGPSIWAAMRKIAEKDREPALLRTVALLREFLNRAGEYSTEQLIRYILMRSNYDAVLCAVPGGKQRSRNVWKFADLAARYNDAGLRGFLVNLQAMRDNGVKNLTDAPLTADDSVKIMTVHKSKGLEFGVVVLPRLTRRVHGAAGKLHFGKEFGIAVDPTRDAEETKPAFFRAVDALNRMLDEEEKKRLLYVALTRARDHLALLMPTKDNTSVSFGKWLQEGLDLDDLTEFHEQPVERSITSGGRTARFLLRSMNVPEIEPPAESVDSADDDGTQTLVLNPTLLDPVGRVAGDITPVPWQSLVRATPSIAEPAVHATIVGSYFHLLMDRMSYKLQPLSREVMVDLLVHSQVGVYHPLLQKQLLEEGEKLLAIFAASPLMQRMKTARRLIHETTYFTMRDGLTQDERRPDLLLEDQFGNWMIIDYKTDHFKRNELARQAKTHRAQLVGYADDFAKLTSLEPGTFVYFAQFGILHELDCRQPVQLRLI